MKHPADMPLILSYLCEASQLHAYSEGGGGGGVTGRSLGTSTTHYGTRPRYHIKNIRWCHS